MSRARGRAHLHLHTQYTPTAIHAKTQQPTDAEHVCTNGRVQSGGMAMLTTQKPTFGITWRDKSSSEPHFVLVLSASFKKFFFFKTQTPILQKLDDEVNKLRKLSQYLGDNWQCKWQQALVYISLALLYSLLSRRLNTQSTSRSTARRTPWSQTMKSCCAPRQQVHRTSKQPSTKF